MKILVAAEAHLKAKPSGQDLWSGGLSGSSAQEIQENQTLCRLTTESKTEVGLPQEMGMHSPTTITRYADLKMIRLDRISFVRE